MPFKTGFRRPRCEDTTKMWMEKLESSYAADHPKYPSQYDTYLQYVAFLTAGAVEHHWTEGARQDGGTPFVPRGRTEDFLPELHKKIRAFRESRYVNGLSSSELMKGAYDLLDFLAQRLPSDAMDRFLALSRTYIIQNEDRCLAA